VETLIPPWRCGVLLPGTDIPAPELDVFPARIDVPAAGVGLSLQGLDGETAEMKV